MIALALLWSCCRALFRDEKAASAVDRALPALFVILALPLMIFIALAVPPGQSPDEPNHVVRVASVVHGQITGRRGRNYWVRDHFEPQTDVKLNLGTAEVAWLGTNPQQYYGAAVQAKIRAVPWSSRTYVSDVPNTGTYPPFLYIPAATGLALVRLLDGTPFDGSYQSSVTQTFKIGVGEVIKGWDEAILTMQKGEKRTLIVPYWLAFGTRGKPPSIPPKATLTFELELVDFK